MELRHLRYFVAVAEELSFSRAAERLHIAQPPLSQQIQALERELEVALFERAGRRVTLTEAGRSFLEDARRVLALVDAGVLRARQVARGEVGRLAVGFNSAAAYGVLPGILRNFRTHYPRVHLTLQEMGSDEQLQALGGGRIDVGFLYLPVPEEHFTFAIVQTEALVVALPEGHPLAAHARIDLADLAGEDFILHPREQGRSYYDCVIESCRRAGFTPRVVQEALLTQTIVSLVASGLGVALLPASVESFRRVGVITRPLAGDTPHLPMAVVWRRGAIPPVLANFLALATEGSG